MERLRATRAAGEDAGRPPVVSPEVWHRALYEDTMCLVAVVDRDGRLLDLNASVKDALGLDGPIEEHTIFDILPEKVARERLALMRRALDDHVAISVEGILWGTMRHCTYRPIDPRGGRDAVLVVSHPRMRNGDDGSEALDHEMVRAKHDDLGPLEALTERELEVMALIGEGLSTSDIAKRLHRSEKTVEWHRASLGHKLGVTNRVELARLALRSGLCSLPGFFRRSEDLMEPVK